MSVSDCLWPHELQHVRLPCPSPSPRVCSTSCPLTQWCHPTRSTIHVELTVICGLRLGVKIQYLSLLTQLHGIISKNPPFSSLYQVVHQAAVHVWMCFCPIGLFILVPMLHCLNYYCFFHKSYIQYFKSSYFLQFLFSRLPWLFSVLWISGYIYEIGCQFTQNFNCIFIQLYLCYIPFYYSI